MRTFKIILFPCIALLIYLLLLGTVFFGSASIADIGTTIGLQIILLIFLQISLVPFNTKTLLKFSVWTLGRGIFLSILSIIFLTKQHTVFIFLTHITLSLYFLLRYYRVESTKKRYYRGTSHQGLSMVAIMLAITYTSTIWVAGATVNLTCNSLQEQSVGFLMKFIPSLDSESGIIKWLSNIDTIGSQSIGEILGTTAANGSGSKVSFAVQGGTGTNIISKIHTGSTENSSGLLGSILTYQESLINGFINNQNLINSQVCDLTLTHINSLAKNNDIQFIVFVLLTLLLYVFMNTITFIIGIINYIILITLFKSGRFIIKYHKEEVEDIYV